MEQHTAANYRKAGLIPLRCKGYHPIFNPEHDYNIAKQPVKSGWNSVDYVPPTDEELEKLDKTKGWPGWLLPKGIIVLDVEVPEDIEHIKGICRERGTEPGIHKTNNGVHLFFRADRNFSAASTVFTKCGIKVTYRVGGKNYLILAPTNNRAWERWKDFESLPTIPDNLLPYDRNNTADVLNCFAHGVREAYSEKHFSGYEDIDAALMAFLIDSKFSLQQVHRVFQIVFDTDYDERQTSAMYERTGSLINNGSPVLGAGTFMMKVKDQGLKEIERFARELQNPLDKTKENKVPVDILSQLFKWDDIAAMEVSTEWLLEGLIPKGAITLVFCPGGGGKTWLLMQIAQVIAKGAPFGSLQTLQCPVYFVDFENPLSVVKERREKIGPAHKFFYWHLACPTGPRKLDDNNWTDYMSLPPGLLIFDTLRASHNGDENSSKDMALVLSRLKELRERGFTIVVLHHTPKGNDGTYKGSTAILDLADHVLSLEKQGKADDDEFDPDAIYKFGCRLKTRFEPNSIFLSFDPEHGFSFKEDPDVETMKIMRDILEKNEPLKQKEFKEIIESKLEMKKSRIFKLFKRGTGTFWIVQKGDKNSMLYSSIPVFPLTKVVENWKTESGSFTEKGKHNEQKSVQSVDAQEFASFPEGNGKTGKHDNVFVSEIEDEIPEIQGAKRWNS